MNNKLRNILCITFLILILSFTNFVNASEGMTNNDFREYDIRIEGSDRTILERTKVKISDKDLDLSRYNVEKNFEEEKPLHVLIKALEEKTNLDLEKDFELLDGSFITKLAEYEQGENSGWMYYLNHDFADAVDVQDLKEGDYLVFYFTENWFDSTYTWFEEELLELGIGESKTLKLMGAGYDAEIGGMVTKGIDNVDILINNQRTNLITDKDGNVKVSFNKPGVYHISGVRKGIFGEDEYINISRPYMKVKVAFKDIENVKWAKDAIYNLNNRGIINGTDYNYYEPFKKTTRAEFASMVLRLFELENEDFIEKNYKDLKKDKWYYDNIQIALELGILKGYEDGTIKPDNFITREEIAKVISRVIKKEGLTLKNKNVLKEFKDEKNISNWAKDDLALLVENRILEGYEDNTLQSKNEATRAETAVMIDRLIDLLKL